MSECVNVLGRVFGWAILRLSKISSFPIVGSCDKRFFKVVKIVQTEIVANLKQRQSFL